MATSGSSGGGRQPGPNTRPAEAPQEGLLGWLVREELSCKIQLKLLDQGRSLSDSAADSVRSTESPLSEETRRMQERRRSNNREAARRCRAKRKLEKAHLILLISQKEQEVEQLRKELAQAQLEFTVLLGEFRSLNCLQSYLRVDGRQLSGEESIWLMGPLNSVRAIPGLQVHQPCQLLRYTEQNFW